MDAVNKPVRIHRSSKSPRGAVEPNVNGRLGKQARKVSRDVQELGRAARDVVQEKLESLRGSASDCNDEGRDKIQQVERTIEQYIRERPLKTVLIAAGVGLLFGRFWMRR